MTQAAGPPPDKITCRCPGCAQQYLVEAVHAGKSVKCRQCQQTFTIAPAPLAPPSGSSMGVPLVRIAGVSPAVESATPSTTPASGPAPASGKVTEAPQPTRGETPMPRPNAGETPATHDTPMPPPPPPPGTALCTVCQSPFETAEEVFHCPGCNAPYHKDCWEYNKGCGVYGCAQVPTTEKLDTLEIPASYWGKEEKNCPACGKIILAAAIRCRHCGAPFGTARPQDAGEFRQRSHLEMNLPKVRQRCVLLMIFSALPCTAPVAAVVGLIWTNAHKAEIQALPALYGALAKISVILSIVETATLVLVAVIHGALR
jgi:hypothetical protein